VHGSTKGKGADLSKSTKVSKTGAKSEAVVAARKAKKPLAANSTADAGAKLTKSGKKALVLADAKAKANATVVSKEESATEVEVEEDVVLTKQAEESTGDLISEFRDLPSRLQETLMPNLERLSQHSKAYLSAMNAGIANGVRPILGDGGRLRDISGGAASVAALPAHRAGAAHGPIPTCRGP
jgi:DNA polymerase II small subunit/DNA polymerase delta subunit B